MNNSPMLRRIKREDMPPTARPRTGLKVLGIGLVGLIGISALRYAFDMAPEQAKWFILLAAGLIGLVVLIWRARRSGLTIDEYLNTLFFGSGRRHI